MPSAVFVQRHAGGGGRVEAVGEPIDRNLHDIIQKLQNVRGQSRAFIADYKGSTPYERVVMDACGVGGLFKPHPRFVRSLMNPKSRKPER